MGSYFVEIYAAARIGEGDGSHHACAGSLTIEARDCTSAMQKAVQHCRNRKIKPCEIRLLSGPDIAPPPGY